MKKLFKKPNWLKPEINEPKYLVHIVILALIVQYTLSLFGHDTGALLSIHTLHFAVSIVFADVIAHTILKID